MTAFRFVWAHFLNALATVAFRAMVFRLHGEQWCRFWYPIYNSLSIASYYAQGNCVGRWWPWQRVPIETRGKNDSGVV